MIKYKYNNGYVFTNDKCIGCGRCMLECPTAETNVSTYLGGKRRIEINSVNCISCGGCIDVCSHDARSFADDTKRFIDDLEAGVSISLIVSPGFFMTYGDRANSILGYLRSLGVNKIYDAGFGADIAVWATVKFLKEYNGKEQDRPFLFNACPTVINYIERYKPDIIRYIIPVHTPMICTSVYAHKYLGDSSKIAFLSECISKKDEIGSAETNGNADYCVTFAKLAEYLKDKEISGFSASVDVVSSCNGRGISVKGGLKEYISACFDSSKIIVNYDGFDSNLLSLMDTTSDGITPHPFVATLASCKDECISGKGSDRMTEKRYDVYFSALRRIRSDMINHVKECGTPDGFYEHLNSLFSELDPADFRREFEDRYIQQHIVPEHIINDIFDKMHKSTEESRHTDCRACGYRTCHDMASAVAKGYSRIEDCSKYVMDEFRKKLFYDDMTGLLSSQGFHIEGRRYMNAHPEKKYVACAGNINDLKSINDMFNFGIGSQVIVYVGRVLESMTRDSGICARLGGNNFIVCVENTPQNIERLMSLKSFDCRKMGISMPVTMRFGLCEIDKINDLPRIVNYASFAMEKNADRTKNSFRWYDEEMRNEIIVETSITAQMRSAMENNEFVMFLQPQYSHSTGSIVGAESLCRWIKPDGTVISPGVFIPIFEKNGFIRELDKFMWECAFKQIRKWADSGVSPVPISVNISRKSLVDDEIIGVITYLQKTYLIDTNLLHFEITESAYTNNQDALITRISKIRELGFEIAMDDFGSGYSSLNTLKDIPIDILKLDMGFLRGDTNREKGGNIIGSVIRMAHSLDLITVAEGVETIEQADFLKSLGCDVIQGYLYARPMPIEQYDKLLADSSRGKVVIEENGKKIDFSRFYDHDSIETHFFDHYIGPAALFEYGDGTLGIIKVNDALVNILGYSESTAIEFSKSFDRGIAPDDRPHVAESVHKAAEGTNGAVCIFGYDRPDGKRIIIRSRIWYLGSNGGKSMIYALCDDVSDVFSYHSIPV